MTRRCFAHCITVWEVFVLLLSLQGDRNVRVMPARRLSRGVGVWHGWSRTYFGNADSSRRMECAETCSGAPLGM